MAFGRGIGCANGGRENEQPKPDRSLWALVLNSLGAGRTATAGAESLPRGDPRNRIGVHRPWTGGRV